MKRNVLVIDDDPIFRMLVNIMINKTAPGSIIHNCENGKEALDALQTLQPLSAPVTVLLDINMPMVNGWDFLEELESNGLKDLSEVKVYIVTSSTDGEDMRKASSRKLVQKFYHKPLETSDIASILA